MRFIRTLESKANRHVISMVSIAAMVLALMAVTGVGQAAAAPSCDPYPDVTGSNEHCANIAWLKGQDITKPADGKYHPTDSVTRGSMAAFLFRITNPGQPQPACPQEPFPDVSTKSTFCGYIAWAKDTGIAYGYSDGHYGANNAVTRGAMAAYMFRIAHPGEGASKCTAEPFKDVGKKDTFCGVITWMKTTGITYGVGSDKYGTSVPVTRQSMASFLKRISEKVTLKQFPPRETTVTPFTEDGQLRLVPGDTQYGPFDREQCSPSPYSHASSVYWCGSAADYLPACWPAPASTGYPLLYCMHSPDDLEVARVTGPSNLKAAPAKSVARPWQVVLDDGSRCNVRIGGAYPEAPTGFDYSYICDGPTGVLVAPTDGPEFITTSPHWKAYASNVSLQETTVTHVGVRKVVFAGATPHV